MSASPAGQVQRKLREPERISGPVLEFLDEIYAVFTLEDHNFVKISRLLVIFGKNSSTKSTS